MKTTEYLDKCKELLELPSDYALSKQLGITRSAMSIYRRKGGTFNNDTAKKVAKILGVHPLRVMVDMERERARTPEDRALWRELVGKLAAIAGAVGLAIAITYPAEVVAAVLRPACVLCKIALRTFRRFAAGALPPFFAPAAAFYS